MPDTACERQLGIIRSLSRLGYDVLLVSPESTRAQSAFDIQGFAYRQMAVNSRTDTRQFFEGLERKPDLAFFDTFISEEYFAYWVGTIFPDTPRILDTQDFHSLRFAREKAYSEGADHLAVLRTPAEDFAPNSSYLREVSAIHRSDHVLTCSTFEKRLFDRMLGSHNNSLVTFFYPPALRDKTVSFARRKNFAWLGNFVHRPNHEAARILVKEVLPILSRELKDDWTIDIYGSNFDRETKNLCKETGGKVRPMALMANLQSLGKYRALVAPVPYGAGIKG